MAFMAVIMGFSSILSHTFEVQKETHAGTRDRIGIQFLSAMPFCANSRKFFASRLGDSEHSDWKVSDFQSAKESAKDFAHEKQRC